MLLRRRVRSLRLAALSVAVSCIAPFACPAAAEELPTAFLKTHCADCHHGPEAAGAIDLTTTKTDLSDRETFARWVKIYDQLTAKKMPPADAPQPPDGDRSKAMKVVQTELLAAEKARLADEGRVPVRRLTRGEYENTIRDLLALDGIPLFIMLPEDGSAFGFDKNSEALDISHVNMAKYVEAADAALDMAIAVQPTPPLRQKHRFSLARHVYLGLMNGDGVMLQGDKPDDVFPPAGEKGHLGPPEHITLLRDSVRRGASVGLFRHEDESFKPYFYDFAAIYPGRYRIRTSFWSYGWDKGTVLPGRGTEVARLSVVQLQENGRGGGHPSYILGYYDAPPNKPQEHVIETWLNPKDTIGYNTASLAPVSNYARPGRALAFKGPGIACDFFEVDGPIIEQWPPEGHRRLFGDLPLVAFDVKKMPGVQVPPRKVLKQETQAPNRPDTSLGTWTVASLWPELDADRLLASFLPKAFRRPVSDELRQAYLALFNERRAAGDCFESALRYAYRAALTSPDFLYHVDEPGRFDDYAVASRLSYFLWNSMPDEQLTKQALEGRLRTNKVVREEVERMLADPKAQRFIDDFLGQWLNMRKIAANDPDRKLYPEFSPYLQDSMLAETRAYFRELLEKDLDASYLVRSDFAMLNEKLATLYGIPGVSGSAIRRVGVPAGCPRGPFLTQAAVMKVTANGTTTSPVPRGAFIMSRFLGKPPEPPPPNVPAVEPDVQGATTIREQLDKHRSIAVCASCHRNIDPPGFALESFDVIGGSRDRYRSLGEGDDAPRGPIDPFIGIGFKLGPKVDPSGEMPDGRKFADVEELQQLLAADLRTLTKNLAEQLCIYAVGRPIGFADRSEINGIVDRTLKKNGGLRTLIHEIVVSRLFLPPNSNDRPTPQVVAKPTLTRNVGAVKDAVSNVPQQSLPPTDEPPPAITIAKSADYPPVRYRLVGLSTPERVEDLHRYLQWAPQIQIADLDVERQEITIVYDPERMNVTNLKSPPTAEQLHNNMDGLLRRVTYGTFSLRLLLASRDGLHREEIAFDVLDCIACRQFVYATAMKTAGVEQAAIDAKRNTLIVWLDPTQKDLTPLREAMEKAKIPLKDGK